MNKRNLIKVALLFVSLAGYSADYSKADLGFIEDEFFSFYTPELLEMAENGDGQAQFKISQCYKYGWGVFQDKNNSEKWFQQSLDAKYPPSLYRVASEYLSKEENYEKAIKLLEEAHRQNYRKATLALSNLLWESPCDPVGSKKKGKYIDNARANDLLVQAAAAGEATAQFQLGNRIVNKNKLEELAALTPTSADAGKQWLEKAAHQLEVNAAWEMIGCYDIPWEGTPKNPEKAESWKLVYFESVRRLATFSEQDTSFWDRTLALLYLDGYGTKKDPSRAFMHMYHAVLKKDFKAMYSLGYFFEKGIGIPSNKEEAIRLYRESLKDPDAQQSLSKELEKEDGIFKDSKLAKEVLMEDKPSSPQK